MKIFLILCALSILTVYCFAGGVYSVTDTEIILSDMPTGKCYPMTEEQPLSAYWDKDEKELYHLTEYCFHPHEIIMRDKIQELEKSNYNQRFANEKMWDTAVENRKLIHDLTKRIKELELCK